jgi:hypothetical protein
MYRIALLRNGEPQAAKAQGEDYETLQDAQEAANAKHEDAQRAREPSEFLNQQLLVTKVEDGRLKAISMRHPDGSWTSI